MVVILKAPEEDGYLESCKTYEKWVIDSSKNPDSPKPKPKSK